MKNPTDLGMNRTGIDVSPIDSKETIAEAERTPPSSAGDVQMLLAERAVHHQQAEPIGTVPPPGSLKGVAKTGLQKLALRKPEVLIDKLAERLAFERSGVRLYEALINKCETRADDYPSLPIDELRRICTEEHSHFVLLTKCMRKLGADPTSMTPCADIVGVESMGLVQVLTDPRTSIAQSLHSILVAELTDHDGWKILIDLAAMMNQDELVVQFQEALSKETEHLEIIRKLFSQLTLDDAGSEAVAA